MYTVFLHSVHARQFVSPKQSVKIKYLNFLRARYFETSCKVDLRSLNLQLSPSNMEHVTNKSIVNPEKIDRVIKCLPTAPDDKGILFVDTVIIE